MVIIKRFAAILMMLSFALCFTVKAFAAEEIVFSEDFTVNEDGNAMYSVNVSKNSNIAGLSLTVNYDKNKLTLLDAFVGESFSSAVSSVNKKIAGTVYMSSVTTVPVSKGGSVLTLVFDGKSTSEISFSVSECIDKDMHSLNYKIKNNETDAPEPDEATTKAVQGSDTSKSDAQNESEKIEKKPADNDKKDAVNSQNQNQNAPATSLDAAIDAANPDGALKNKEDSTNPSVQNTSGSAVQHPTSDAATTDESNQPNNYIFLIIAIFVLCAVAIIIIYLIKKRRIRHEK